MIVGVLQARMSSRRLPGKVCETIAGKPMIERQLERIRRAQLDDIVVATSNTGEDSVLCEMLERIGARCFRGSLDDVLDRVYRAALTTPASHVVRLTGDCPLIDHRVIDRVIEAHLCTGADYTSNTLVRSFPDGLDVEVMSLPALQTAWREADSQHQREHVTPFIYEQPNRFRLHNVANEADLSRYRLTVDYPDDLAVVRSIFDELYPVDPAFSLDNIIALLETRPDLVQRNASHNLAVTAPETVRTRHD